MEKLNQQSFAQFIASGKKVVEFNAGWCVDCKRVAPFLPEIEKKFSSNFQFGEIDVDESRSIAEQYNVRGIPTFIVFEDGRETGRLPSREAKTQEQIETFLEQMAK
ncbi:thioredoxin family protein [Polycladomyces subterraneus]|uniref:Thioredoxin n=1 Tax=Polycladomyces subterraneus TaxID=1016997 RepID=A0ABT8INJ3_9BACL|nr:thioredoxin family protein [Polycladomyces subterraneus]MDN4594345.1 thioredoxin family protein [Polycladomyces subterraneus]